MSDVLSSDISNGPKDAGGGDLGSHRMNGEAILIPIPCPQYHRHVYYNYNKLTKLIAEMD